MTRFVDLLRTIIFMSENISERQKELYEKIHEIYKAHYYETFAQPSLIL